MSPGLAWVDGASGFIGSHLTAHLRAVGWEVEEASVRVGRPIALPHGATVFHLAGLAHDAGADPQGLMRANRDLTLAVYEAAVAAEARAFVHVSSAAVLGGGRDDPADENAPMRPQGAYAASKAEAEAALRQSQGRVPIAIARPPLVYGPGVKANFLRLLQWLTKRRPVPGVAAAGRRSLVSIANLTHALETIGRATPTQDRCRIWHVRDGEDVTFDELCRLLGKGLMRRHASGRCRHGSQRWALRLCVSAAVRARSMRCASTTRHCAANFFGSPRSRWPRGLGAWRGGICRRQATGEPSSDLATPA